MKIEVETKFGVGEIAKINKRFILDFAVITR